MQTFPQTVPVYTYDWMTYSSTINEFFDIKKLRNSKATGETVSIPETPVSLFHKIIYQTCVIDWSHTVPFPLYEKGEERCCNNYCRISLIYIATKIFAAILLKRFLKQTGFWTRPLLCSSRIRMHRSDLYFPKRLYNILSAALTLLRLIRSTAGFCGRSYKGTVSQLSFSTCWKQLSFYSYKNA